MWSYAIWDGDWGKLLILKSHGGKKNQWNRKQKCNWEKWAKLKTGVEKNNK